LRKLEIFEKISCHRNKYASLYSGQDDVRVYYNLMLVAISRHGDRTPDWTLPVPPGDHDVAWNCSLNTLHIPSNGTDLFEPLDYPRLYRKVYIEDREVILGNCALGQLTSKGFEQTKVLGKLLRKMYLCPSSLRLYWIFWRSSNEG
jgi:hypothetical protein